MSYLFSYAQSDLENNNKPGISFDDDSKTRTENNFPAYSSNGKYIVLIHSDYSCCLGTPIEFHLIKIANQTIEKKIILSPGEDETPFSVEKIKQNILNKQKSINDMCNAYPDMMFESDTEKYLDFCLINCLNYHLFFF